MYVGAKWTYVGESAGSAKGHDGVGLTGGQTGSGAFLRKKTPIKSVYCKWAYGHKVALESVYASSWLAGAKHKKRKAGAKPCQCNALDHTLGTLIGSPEEQAKWTATKLLLTARRRALMGKKFFRVNGKIERL